MSGGSSVLNDNYKKIWLFVCFYVLLHAESFLGLHQIAASNMNKTNENDMKRIIELHLRTFLMMAVLMLAENVVLAQDELPTISPTATYTTSQGEEVSDNKAGSAPLTCIFRANPKNVGDYTPSYEWRFYLDTMEGDPYLVRYEEETEYTFMQAGQHFIVCYATFVNGNDTVAYTTDYWGTMQQPLACTINRSILEMPNAFSPNGDTRNDFYHVKKHESLIEFHAIIFNRWGQKLYEWDDPNGEGWDGKFNGHDVKDGVYFVLVKAKGADGRVFNIKKDINLLRGYITESGSTSNEP